MKYLTAKNKGLKSSFLLRDLDITLAILGIILSIIAILTGVIIGRIMYLLMGGLVLISCSLWLVIRNGHTFLFHSTESRTKTKICAICFFGLYTSSILTIYLRPELYQRPLLYFILTALMAGIIAYEILTSGRRHVAFIFIQILLLGMSIAWSQLLIFPSLLGIDPWYHFALTNRIIDGGFIPEGYDYSSIPLFHIIVASTSLITGLSYKFAVMVSVSLGQIFCNAIFVFLIADYLFKNHRVALLAALMLVIANQQIRMSFWSIPNAFAAIFILIVIYLSLCVSKDSIRKINTNYFRIIIMLMFVTIILTHTITAMCMAIILFVAWSALTLYRIIYPRAVTVNDMSPSVPLVFTVMMFGWWIYVSGSIEKLGHFIRAGFSVDAFVSIPVGFLNYASQISLGEQLFNIIGQYLFFAISLIGVFYMVSRRGNSSAIFVAASGVTPIAIVFLTSLSGTTVIDSRWWYFAQILLSIPMAFAIYLILTWKSKKTTFPHIFGFLVVIILSFVMVMSTSANIDNHIFSPVTGSTDAYTQSELVASGFFSINSIGVLSSDSTYCTSPSGSIFINVYGIDPGRLNNLDDSLITGKFNHDGSIKILRSACIQESLIRGGYSFPVRPDLNNYVSNMGFDRIYVNPMINAYTG